MLKIDDASIRRVEKQYPGFRETLDYYESLDLPSCPKCGSTDSAKVSSGLVGRSIHLAAATTKIKLVPNGHPADFHCGACDQFFDARAAVNGRAPRGRLAARPALPAKRKRAPRGARS